MTLKNVVVQYSSKKITYKKSEELLEILYSSEDELDCGLTPLILLMTRRVRGHSFPHLQKEWTLRGNLQPRFACRFCYTCVLS